MGRDRRGSPSRESDRIETETVAKEDKTGREETEEAAEEDEQTLWRNFS